MRIATSLKVKATQTGLLNYFDVVFSSHSFGVPKEHPSFWQQLEAALGFDPQRTLFVDDSHSVLRARAEPRHRAYLRDLEAGLRDGKERRHGVHVGGSRESSARRGLCQIIQSGCELAVPSALRALKLFPAPAAYPESRCSNVCYAVGGVRFLGGASCAFFAVRSVRARFSSRKQQLQALLSEPGEVMNDHRHRHRRDDDRHCLRPRDDRHRPPSLPPPTATSAAATTGLAATTAAAKMTSRQRSRRDDFREA